MNPDPYISMRNERKAAREKALADVAREKALADVARELAGIGYLSPAVYNLVMKARAILADDWRPA